MHISGPAAGDERLKTSDDPTGMSVIGTLNDCAGGVTPWGTVLMGEENFDGYFAGELAKHNNPQVIEREKKNLARYGLVNKPKSDYSWSRFYDRFQIENEPRECNRFGWVVEYDPYNRDSVPVKRTALGRFKHEGATCTLAPNGRVVVYSGDDGKDEFLYRFVSDCALRSDGPREESRSARSRHALRGAVRARWHAGMAAAGARQWSAHRAKRFHEAG